MRNNLIYDVEMLHLNQIVCYSYLKKKTISLHLYT